MLYAVLVLTIILLYVIIFWLENFVQNGRPPGPLRFPPFGNLVQIMLQDKLPFVALLKLSQKYGDVMSIKMGLLDTVIFSSYESTRQVFSKEESFGKACTGIIFERNLRQNVGLAFIQPPEWTESRTFLRNALRKHGFEQREDTRSLLLDELVNVIKAMEDEARDNKGRVHFHSDYFTNYLMSIMCTYLFGRKLGYDNPDFQGLLKSLHDVAKHGAIGTGIMMAYPFLRFIFPKALGFTEQMKGIRGTQEIAMKLLEDRKQAGTYKVTPECFTDEFLIKMDEAASKSNSIYTADHYVLLFSDVLQGGSESTSNVINFTLLQLVINQNIQQKVYQEIYDVIGGERFPSLDDKAFMPYTQAVLLEGLRWSRVFVMGVPRKATEDFTYRDYCIKKGTVLMFNLHAIFFDEEKVDEPKVFRPERYLDEDGNLDKKQEPLIAFGTGKRDCFGQTKARDTLFMFITTLIQRFHFTLPEGHTPSVEPSIAMTLHPKPYTAIIKKRAS